MPTTRLDDIRGDDRRVIDSLVDQWLEDTQQGKHMIAVLGPLRARNALYALRDKDIVIFEAGAIAEDGTMPFRIRINEHPMGL